MALSADLNTILMTGNEQQIAYPIKDATKIYGGGLVATNAAGYLIEATDTAGLQFVGIATKSVNNLSGSAGDLDATVETGAVFKVATTGAAITDMGRPVFIEDDESVDIVNGNVPVGRIVKYVSATSVWVKPEKLTYAYLDLPFQLDELANGDVGPAITLRHNALIVKVEFIMDIITTTGSKLATLNLEIGTTNLTGGVIALTSANTDAAFDVVAGTAITGANWAPAGSVIQVEASSVTAFVEGSGWLRIHYVY